MFPELLAHFPALDHGLFAMATIINASSFRIAASALFSLPGLATVSSSCWRKD